MKLLVTLALKDLLRDRLFLICNVAALAGVLVPLMVLFGVKNGVYDRLIGDLMRDPATLQIDTSGNNDFSQEDATTVRDWPESGFVTLKTRSLFDFINVAPVAGGGVRDAVAVPSGPGDPSLPEGVGVALGEIAVSHSLAEQLSIAEGDMVRLVTQAPERARQLLLESRVTGIVPSGRLAGRAVLVDLETLDLIEAFYDSYALPEYGIDQGRDLADRVVSYEGLRVYARDLESLRPLQTRIEATFGVRTDARTRDVESVLGLGRNLNLALGLTVAVASLGLTAALVFGFWSDVARKRTTLATLGLLGLPAKAIALIPVIQALVTAGVGLAVSFALYGIASLVAARMFSAEGGDVTRLDATDIVLIACAVFLLVTLTSGFAARAAGRLDPASVLREGS